MFRHSDPHSAIAAVMRRGLHDPFFGLMIFSIHILTFRSQETKAVTPVSVEETQELATPHPATARATLAPTHTAQEVTPESLADEVVTLADMEETPLQEATLASVVETRELATHRPAMDQATQALTPTVLVTQAQDEAVTLVDMEETPPREVTLALQVTAQETLARTHMARATLDLIPTAQMTPATRRMTPLLASWWRRLDLSSRMRVFKRRANRSVPTLVTMSTALATLAAIADMVETAMITATTRREISVRWYDIGLAWIYIALFMRSNAMQWNYDSDIFSLHYLLVTLYETILIPSDLKVFSGWASPSNTFIYDPALAFLHVSLLILDRLRHFDPSSMMHSSRVSFSTSTSLKISLSGPSLHTVQFAWQQDLA
jgi:hypothetical protein